MKTVKFLAMIMAASALSFTFTACGSDDDDVPMPIPTPAVTETPQVNEIRILGESATLTSAGYGYYGTHHIELFMRTDYDNAEAGKETALWFDIHGIEPVNGYIPTGSYPIMDENSGEVCYQIFNGCLNRTQDWSAGYDFMALPGSSNMVVERSGETYTVTIERLVIAYTNLATQEAGVLTTSFKYQGSIENTSGPEDQD